jgi:predicted negative regulator of RcsB-dependent stress response
VDEAIALAARTSDNCSAAELHRIRGEILISQSKTKPAFASFETALAIARQQRATSWEQRILASQATAS